MLAEQLPITQLPAFAHLNSIALNGLTVSTIPGAGAGLRHTHSRYDPARALLTVGRDLVVCAANVEEHAKADARLAEVLRAVGDFALTPRGAIMVFLAVTLSTAAGLEAGQRGSWSEYIKFLPGRVSMPTTWTDLERKLLESTSLHAAVQAKLQALEQEFAHIQSTTSNIRWCAHAWWEEQTLTLSDWKHLDSLFRSRMLEYPGLGVGMAPLIDFANHSANANAYYSIDSNHDIVLLLRENKESLGEGEEVTINYGPEKSAAELLFSYGFLSPSHPSAGRVALDLKCPPDDPLALAKETTFRSTPILLLTDTGSEVTWTGAFIWLMSINEEDGLSFRVLQSTDGVRQLRVLWHGEEVDDVSNLEGRLEASGLWEVYQLRALVLVQERIEVQLGELMKADEELANMRGVGDDDGGKRWIGSEEEEAARKLRELEKRLMERAVASLEDQKEKLLDTVVVKEYLKRTWANDDNGNGNGNDGGIEREGMTEVVADEEEDLS